jgi:toxin FitB
VVFLLDTNILSELVRRQPHAKVLEQFNATPEHELFTSVVCVEEIRFGCRLVPHG